MAERLPFLSVSGTHFEVGVQQGQKFAERIKSFLAKEDTTDFLNWCKTDGKADFDALVAANKALYPHIFEEMEGISTGSGIPMDTILPLNLFELVLKHLIQRSSEKEAADLGTKACTDLSVLIHKDDDSHFLMGHNEDMPLHGAVEYCYLLESKVTGQPSYTAFVYPGMVAGNAFTWNSEGVVVTINYLCPTQFDMGGASTAFLCRDLITSKTITELMSRIPGRRASGVSMNIASAKEKRIVNIEFAQDLLSIKEVRGVHGHANKYKYIDIPQLPSPSSESREKRICEFSEKEAADLNNALGDTKYAELPIFRVFTPSERSATCATVICDLEKLEATVYITNPKERKPHMVFKM